MNVHDSERLAGLLEAAGYERAADGTDADVVVFNTCAVRENADNKLYGNLSHLAPRKQADPDMQIAVGGCLAQKDRDAVLQEGPMGGRRVRDPQHRFAADAARPRPSQPASPGRNRRGAAGIPVCAARRARIRLRRMGFDLGRLQQHLHVLHRARAARQGGRPQARRRAGRSAVAGRPGRARGDAARARTSTPTASRLPTPISPAIAAHSPSCCAHAGGSTASSGSVHLAAPRRVHRRRDRGDGGDTECVPGRCTCRCSPGRTGCCGPCAARTAPSATSASSTRCGPRSRTPRSPPT